MSWVARLWARIRRVAHPEVPRPADLLHWSPEHNAYPLCGARLGSRWTIEFPAASCPRCHELGLSIYIQHWVSTR